MNTNIDLSYLKEMSNNNKNIMTEMVEIFIEQNNEFTEEISNHFKNKQWARLGAIAHKAKSSVRIVGMNELGDCLDKIEHYSKGNKKIEIQQNLENNHKLDNNHLRIWNNVRNENISDINLEFIPSLIKHFLEQNPVAVTALKKTIKEL